jgi:WD40 repeat protein
MTIEVWDVGQGRRVDSWPAVPRLSAVGFSPDERWCLISGYQGDACWRDLHARKSRSVTLNIGTTECIAFSPDSRLVAAANWSSVAPVWEVGALRERAVLGRFLLGAHSVAFSPDNARIAVTSGGKESLKLWSAESHQELLTLESQESRFMQGAFSSDGSTIGALSMEGHLHLWHARSWEEIEGEQRQLPLR